MNIHCLTWLVALVFLTACAVAQAEESAPLAAYEIVTGETDLSDAPFEQQLIVKCPEGKRALGAGWAVLDKTGAIKQGRVSYFMPSYDGSGWMINASDDSDWLGAWKIRLRVMCAKVQMFDF
ncbi:hypothetical protein [uncultured Pseudoteredinibacter sp.]|uniref:hypothetical protein n=1 Tax=uncultured Pseudoteredinibacter sp. TaxID=1641701 RepID=UPI00263249BC|nr:hypothetical protein [uncultured Pseudoteredinibacter sp.]